MLVFFRDIQLVRDFQLESICQLSTYISYMRLFLSHLARGFHADSTVSNPRFEVVRVLRQYISYVTKAKEDKEDRAARHLLAQRESNNSKQPALREGNRRGTIDCRPDIVAYNLIKAANVGVNPGVTVGVVPGVDVGDMFSYRHQMSVVGLHQRPNQGIDYGFQPPPLDRTILIATAVVLMPKAGYVDNQDDGARILYAGMRSLQKNVV